MNRFLAPFCSEARLAGSVKILWTVLLLGAPIALLAALWVDGQLDARRPADVEVDRDRIVGAMQTLASGHGVDASQWKAYISTQGNTPEGVFRRGADGNIDPLAKRLTPAMEIVGLLRRPDGGAWLQARFSGGQLIGFHWSGRHLYLRPAPDRSADAVRVAQEEWQRVVPGWTPRGTPEVQHATDEDGAAIRRIVWREPVDAHPEISFSFLTEVRDGRVRRLEVKREFSEAFLRANVAPDQSRGAVFTSFRVVFVVCLVLYACYRYVRRSIEKEAPHPRALALALAMLALGAIILWVDPYFGGQPLTPETAGGALLALMSFAAVANSLLQGIVVGVSYGAGETELREAFPRALTSFDTLLTGKVFSQNVGASVVAGAAVAFWVLLMNRVGVYLLGPETLPVPIKLVGLSLGSLPLVPSLLNIPVVGITLVVIGLMVPLIFLRRHVRRKPLLLTLLFLCTIITTNLTESPIEFPGLYSVDTLTCAAGILLPFFLLDLLAATVTSSILYYTTTIGDLSHAMPVWRSAAPVVMVAGLALLALFVWTCWRGRRYEDAQVRPVHARVLAERLALQAELSLAREAQLRLLPETIPSAAGISIAASCTPAKTVGGDFYDFYPLPGGQLGLFVAEGGNDGLASALAIALTKGFLLYESQRSADPRTAIEHLDRMLGEMLRRESGTTSLAFLTIDPATRHVRIARSGQFPRVMLVSIEGGVSEVPLKAVTSPNSHPVSSADLSVPDHHALVIFTDGLQRELERQAMGAPEDLLRRSRSFSAITSAADLHSLLLDSILQGKTGTAANPPQDDLTAVVVYFNAAATARLEGAA